MDFINTFNGLMLSDGGIYKNSIYCHYYQKCKYEEWLRIIASDFINNDIKVSIGNKQKHIFKLYNSISYYYQLQSSDHKLQFLKDQHDRWYYKDYNIDEYSIARWKFDEEKNEWFAWHKKVPNSIKLTPECVLNWYLGDGNILRRKGRKNAKIRNSYALRISTESFTKDSVDYLLNLMNSKVTDYTYSTKTKSGYVITITTYDGVKSFLDYIKDLPHPSCYDYKFPKLN